MSEEPEQFDLDREQEIELLRMALGSGSSGGEVKQHDLSDLHPDKILVGDHIGDFEILEEVGRGGMGVVYKVFEKSLRRVVALKVLHERIAGFAPYAKRFRQEAILAANLNHPNIVPVHQIDNREKPRFFTMEYVPGKSLREKIGEEGYLDESQAIRITLQACEALQYAHEHHIIHRDIKPGNILLHFQYQIMIGKNIGVANTRGRFRMAPGKKLNLKLRMLGGT